MPGCYDAGMQRVLIFLFALIAIGGGYAYFADIVEAPGTPQDRRIMSAEEYVRQNIAQLSPEPAVFGGTFHVTAIEAADGPPRLASSSASASPLRDGSGEAGRGTVWYEDGHIALVADFEYVVDAYGISIVSFEVRQ